LETYDPYGHDVAVQKKKALDLLLERKHADLERQNRIAEETRSQIAQLESEKSEQKSHVRASETCQKLQMMMAAHFGFTHTKQTVDFDKDAEEILKHFSQVLNVPVSFMLVMLVGNNACVTIQLFYYYAQVPDGRKWSPKHTFNMEKDQFNSTAANWRGRYGMDLVPVIDYQWIAKENLQYSTDGTLNPRTPRYEPRSTCQDIAIYTGYAPTEIPRKRMSQTEGDDRVVKRGNFSSIEGMSEIESDYKQVGSKGEVADHSGCAFPTYL